MGGLPHPSSGRSGWIAAVVCSPCLWIGWFLSTSVSEEDTCMACGLAGDRLSGLAGIATTPGDSAPTRRNLVLCTVFELPLGVRHLFSKWGAEESIFYPGAFDDVLGEPAWFICNCSRDPDSHHGGTSCRSALVESFHLAIMATSHQYPA